MGKWERSRRSLRWSINKFNHNGRGLKQGYISQKQIESARWLDMKHQYPGRSLVFRLHAVHCNRRFEEALASLTTPEELPFERRYRRRLTVSLAVFRLTASFLLLLAFSSLSANAERLQSAENALYRKSLSKDITLSYKERENAHRLNSSSRNAALAMYNTAAVPGNETVNIQGTVTNAQTGSPLSVTKVVLIRTDNGQRLDSTYTNQNGHYNKDFIVSFTGGFPDDIAVNCAWPNPSQKQVNIRFYANENGIYNLKSVSADGKPGSDLFLELKQGINVVTMSGGESGIFFIRITNGRQKADYRILRLQGTGVPVTYQVTSKGASLKSTHGSTGEIWPGMEITMEFSKAGYYTSDTTFVVSPTQTVDMKMQAVATIHGTIKGNIYNNPLMNAKAVLLYQGNRIDSIYTSQNGQYSLSAPGSIALNEPVGMEFSAPDTNYTNYFQGDTAFVLQTTQTINKKLEQVPVTNDFLIDAYSIVDGTPAINGTALKVTWGDGTSNTYSSSNGQIHVLRENTYDTATMIHLENADTSFYQEWIFGVKKDPLITTKEKNLFQSEKELSPALPPNGSGEYIYPTPAPANILLLPNNFDVYFVPNLVYNSENEAFNTRGVYFRTVVQCRGPPGLTKKWEFIPQVADTVLLYDMQIYNLNVNQPITPAQSLAQKAAMDSVETQLFYLQGNGRHLMPPYKRVNISTMTEPEWVKGQARSFDQTHRTEFSLGNNNSCWFTLDYAWGDWYRFMRGTSNYEINSNISYKIEELVGSFLHCRDPPQGNLGGFVVDATGSFTSFGKALHMILLADPGTKFW